MNLPWAELMLLVDAARRAGRPVTVDRNNYTLRVPEHNGPEARTLYEIREDFRDGSLKITDRR